MKMASLALAATALWAAAMPAGNARAADITVLGTPGVREFYAELVAQFEKETGHKVATTWAGTVDVTKRISGGETVDLVIMAGNSLEELIRLGKIVPGSRVDVARSGIGLAVRAGAPRPDISSGDAVKQTLLAAKSIAYSSGPSGIYLAGLVQRMGIADQIKQKMKQIPPGEAVGDLVARGEAEIGLHQMSELLPVKGIDIVGPLPPDVQQITVFSAGLHVGASNPDAAQALVRFITAPAAAAAIKKHGMEPG
jgi:molybdate transport system substrate-binding protein